MDVWHNPSEQLRDRKRLNVTHKEAVAKAEAVLERRAAGRTDAKFQQRIGASTTPARPIPPALSTLMDSVRCRSARGVSHVSEESRMFTSLPAELKTLVAEKLDVRSLGNFASASAECQSAAHNELRAALVVAVRHSLAPVSGRLPWGQRAISVALVSDTLVACPYFRLPDELVANLCQNQAVWPARSTRAAAWPRLAPEPGSARGKAEPACFRHRYPSQMAPSTTAPPSARSPCPPPSPSSATLPSRAAPSSPRSICPPPSKRSATSPSHAAGGNKVALTSATAGALGKPISALTRALGCPKLRPASRPISRSGHGYVGLVSHPGMLHLAH